MSETFATFDLAASGLRAQRVRASVIAKNIANAHVTQTDEGGPYRRQRTLFESVARQAADGTPAGGVTIREIAPDPSPFTMVEDPSHPDAVDGCLPC